MARISVAEIPEPDGPPTTLLKHGRASKSNRVRLVRVDPILSPDLASSRISSEDVDRSPSSLSRIYLADSTELHRKSKMVAVVTKHPSARGLNINLTSTTPVLLPRKEMIERRSVSKLSRHSIDTLTEDVEDTMEHITRVRTVTKIRVPDSEPTDHVIVTKSLPATQPTLDESDPNLSQSERPLIHRIVRRHFFSKNVDRKDKTKADGKLPRYWNDSCPCCSFWCCLITTGLITLLLLAGFITALVLLLTNRSTAAAALNTETSTLSTLPTIPTTSTTGTTTITTSSSTTTTTVVRTCAAGWSNFTTLYDCGNCNSLTSYTQFTQNFTANSPRTRISFAFQQDKGCFGLDDVSVRGVSGPTAEVLQNNGFETSSFTAWTYCNATNPTGSSQIVSSSTSVSCGGPTGRVQGGSFALYETSQGNDASYLSQLFNTTIGEVYTVSYWFYKIGPGQGNNLNVMISI